MDSIGRQIDVGTVQAFESVCSLLGHHIIGQFSIFDGAWQVIQFAVLEGELAGDLSPADCACLRAAVTDTLAVVQSAMQINENIRRLLFPEGWGETNGLSERELNEVRWSPYDRAAWNAFFAEVCQQLESVFVLLDQIGERLTGLHELRIEQAFDAFGHFEPMLAMNLRERLLDVIQTYTLAQEA